MLLSHWVKLKSSSSFLLLLLPIIIIYVFVWADRSVEFYDFLHLNAESINASEVIDNSRKEDYEEVNQEATATAARPLFPFIDFFLPPSYPTSYISSNSFGWSIMRSHIHVCINILYIVHTLTLTLDSLQHLHSYCLPFISISFASNYTLLSHSLQFKPIIIFIYIWNWSEKLYKQ